MKKKINIQLMIVALVAILSSTLLMSAIIYEVFRLHILREGHGQVNVVVSAESVRTLYRQAIPWLLLVSGAVMLLCMWLGHLLTRKIVAPIEQMARQMQDGVIEPPYKELIPFADMMRKQHESVLQAVRMRQDFTANVSHELKTPLTAISGYAELIENGMVEGKETERICAEIRRNATRLLALINDIIELSRLDQAQKEQAFEETNLYQIAEKCIEDLQINAAEHGVQLSIVGVDTNLRGNPEMLRELITNLTINAIRYNNRGGWVKVSVHQEEGHPVLTVSDNGIGIPRQDQERVFERFYRVDKSRSRQTGGTGLGLAIVRHIAMIHDAQVQLESELGRGTRVRVIF